MFPQFGRERLQPFLRLPVIGHVAYGAHDHGAFVDLQRAETDLYRKLGPLFMPAEQLQPGAHGAGPWLREIVAPMSDMVAAKPFRKQQFDWPSQ